MSNNTNILTVINNIGTFINCKYIVAGGAIRDLIGNRPINDIDMYVNTSQRIRIEKKLKANNIPYNFKKPTTPTTSSSYSKVNKSITNVINFTYSGQDVDLIFTRDYLSPYGLFRTYDNNLCKFAYDGVNITAPREAMDDLINQTITKNPTVSSACWEYSKKKHIPKILKKYQGFRVIEDGKDITHEFGSVTVQSGSMPMRSLLGGGISAPGQFSKDDGDDQKLSISEIAEMLKAGAIFTEETKEEQSDLYCACVQPIIVHNEAFGKAFKYCKACCKEKQ